MKINTAKSALKQSNPEKAACTAPLMESSAESRPNAPASIHEPQQRDYFTQWWNEYQRKMRVRFQPELLKPKANINQKDFQESCPVSPSVCTIWHFQTRRSSNRVALKLRATVPDHCHTDGSCSLAAVHLPREHGNRAPAGGRPQSEPGCRDFLVNPSVEVESAYNTANQRCRGSGTLLSEWNQRSMDVSPIAKLLIFEFNES